MITIEILLHFLTTILGFSAALYVVCQPHPVFAVMALIFLALITALRWWVYGAFFFSLILLLIYLGAVLVLFLFVVMTLSQQHNFTMDTPQSSRFYNTLVGSIIFWFVCQKAEDLSHEPYCDLSVVSISEVLVVNSEVLMQLVGLFLLLAMLVAVILLGSNSSIKKDNL
jgi:NADH-quinone oxidoreductase subunit J